MPILMNLILPFLLTLDRGGPSYKTMTRIFAFAVIGGNYFARVVRKNCQPGLR